LIALASAVPACKSHHTSQTSASAPFTTESALSGAVQPTSITVDGDTADWPGDAVIVANEHYIFIRFAVEDQQYTLQASPTTTAIMLDTDGDARTGRTSDLVPLNSMGVDLEIDFSPHGRGEAGHGVAVYALDSAGRKSPLSTADVDFCCAPTYASSWYECRISRTPDHAGALPRGGMLSSGMVRGVVATLDKEGKIDGYTDPFSINVGRACATGKFLSSADLPDKPEGAVRVMAYNVERSNPVTKPESFRRIFQAVKPDVILLEEWEAGDAAALQAWFTAMVSSDQAWNVRKPEGTLATGGGVAIVTHCPLLPMIGDTITLPPGSAGRNSPEHKVRFVGAKITTPAGELLTGGVHLKCCGTKDSSEDLTRMAEARAINACFTSAAGAAGKSTIRLIAGDFNLVGSRPPLDLIRAGLDADGSDLALAAPMVLGDSTLMTWRDAPSGYAPGRLDYLAYSKSNAQIVNAFVLDTARLSDESLARMGLDRADCDGSDHLPVIADIKAAGH
jgi:endonuclease/exonuclease/phosphatase family metal-dependent hydrolase